jgi:hypothetical protein
MYSPVCTLRIAVVITVDMNLMKTGSQTQAERRVSEEAAIFSAWDCSSKYSCLMSTVGVAEVGVLVWFPWHHIDELTHESSAAQNAFVQRRARSA